MTDPNGSTDDAGQGGFSDGPDGDFGEIGALRRDDPPPPPPPPPPPDPEAEIRRLASLTPFAFEREVAEVAELLGFSVSVVRKIVKAERRANRTKSRGEAPNLPEIELWPEPVDGDALLDAVTAAIRRHVIVDLAQGRVIALWVVAAHCFNCFAVFPRLFVTAVEKQCGKSTLLDVVSLLVPRPMIVANITPAGLFRVIAALKPTTLLDEFDAYLKRKEVAEELRQLIDAGHKRGGMVIRLVGEDHELRQFDVYAPVVIAAIDKIAATLMDRSLIIWLKRRLPSEEITPLRLDRAPELCRLARQIARSAADHLGQLTDADPVMGELINRPADNWRPLYAVAELAGNGWSDLARDAAETVISATAAMDAEGRLTLLLSDIRAAFAAKKAERLTSEAIVEYLVSLEHRPWPEWGKTKKPISKVQVARLLAPLRITPGTIHPARNERGAEQGNETEQKGVRGYTRKSFRDAFNRYLPPEPSDRGFGAD